MAETQTFDHWCIVELFGHQRTAGRVRPAEFPAGHVRLEIPATSGHEAMTQILNPQAIYRLTPTTEALATAFAAECRPVPVSRWELPAADPEPVGVGASPYAGDEGPF
jgi:hypothetical protein